MIRVSKAWPSQMFRCWGLVCCEGFTTPFGNVADIQSWSGEKATGTIKRELGHDLKLYKIPDLTFVKDESIEYGNKIDEMLRNLDKN